MLNKLFFIVILLFPYISIAQNNKTSIFLPMKDGKIFYEKSYTIKNGVGEKQLFAFSNQWLKNDSSIAKKSIKKIGGKNSELIATGLFKIVTSNTGNYYLVKFEVKLTISDTGYVFKVGSFYEKPIENGISNEYSKLEYRWWDFRQGKPWSAEDEPLFKGIVADENVLQLSFENVINNINYNK